MCTVWSSTLVTASIDVSRPFMSEAGWRARSSEKTTSSALNGLPSWNLTPWRSLNSHTAGSSVTFQETASVGRILPVWSRTSSGS